LNFWRSVLLTFLSSLVGLQITGRPGGEPSFHEGAEEAGLGGFILRSGTPEKKYIMETMSAGVCLFDYNNDGRVDIYLVNGGTFAPAQSLR